MPKDSLEKASTKIVVVGCGEWNPIKGYAGTSCSWVLLLVAVSNHFVETTGFHGAIFADPSRQVYRALGMNIENLAGTPAGEKKRSYLKLGLFTNAIRSTWVCRFMGWSTRKHVLNPQQNGPLKNPSLIGKQGNISQLGGEFVLGPGM